MQDVQPLTIQQRLNEVQRLMGEGRLGQALGLIRSAPSDQATGLEPAYIALLKQGQFYDELIALRRQAVRAQPASVATHHNLASALGDAGRNAEAVVEARAALERGGKAPETWLVLARALAADGRHDEAVTAYGEALARRPDYVEAVKELAQLLWMAGHSVEEARAPYVAALDRSPDHPAILAALSAFNLYVGMKPDEVWRDLIQRRGTGRAPAVEVELAAADLALEFDPDLAIQHARSAVTLNRNEIAGWTSLAKALLVRGRHDEAHQILTSLVQAAPQDQLVLALHASVVRAMGRADPLGLDDADNLIRAYQIDSPEGWADLGAYLADLATALEAQHAFSRHPIGQSLRQGSQTPVDLRRVDDPVIQSFFAAIDRPIRQHLAHLGQGKDPVRRRNTGDYRLNGCWSVRLRSGGFHEAHIHGKGWLSSACYIDLPPAVGRGGQEGWIGFGSPPFSRMKPLAPLKVEMPEPGKLVLFPSCMWHGTLPFEDERHRLTIAFDLIPA